VGEGDLFDFAKELEVLWVRPRPATFNIMDAEFIQFLGDSNFVLGRESNILCLGTVAKGGVVDLDGIKFAQNDVTS
jgi:hypothetical protein